MIAQFVKEKRFHFHQEMKDKIRRSISLHGGNFLSTLSSQSVERVFISTVGSDPLSIKLFFFVFFLLSLPSSYSSGFLHSPVVVHLIKLTRK
jgi:hypothetical protein